MIPFNKPTVVGREFEHIYSAIARGQLSGDGHFTRLCNSKIAQLAGTSTAMLTHSCTAALEMAAILCDLKPGDEVIMPSYTFVSTANSVVLRGAMPVFVDICPNTLNIDPTEVEAALTCRTRAIFAVHYAGFPADMDSLTRIAKKNELLLVEDAAQALGSTYKGRLVGSLGDMAAFSFHETKNIICGEGGALALSSPELIERAEIIREKGTNRSNFMRGQVDKYTWVDIGSSFLPGELIAAFLNGQLEEAEQIRKVRLSLFQQYLDAFGEFSDAGLVSLPRIPRNVTGNGHMFYLIMNTREQRDDFITHMRDNGIYTPFHYVPLHSSPYGKDHSQSWGKLPVTKEISSRLVRLPMYFSLQSSISQVIEVTRGWFEKGNRFKHHCNLVE